MNNHELQTEIVYHYGINSQYDLLIEECAELIQAIQKMKRYNNNKSFYRKNIMFEMADVKNLIEQICLYYGDTLEFIIKEKCERQIKRIEEEQ